MKKGECIIKIVSGERHTPFALAESLKARCILESSSFEKGKERYSLLLVKEAFQLVQNGPDILLRPAGTPDWQRVKSRARDILDVCRYFADQHREVHQDFPFPAGGIGYLSYEFSRFCDKVHFAGQPDPLGMPDAAYLFGHVFIVFDHYTDLLYLIGLNYAEAAIDLEAELRELEERLAAGFAGEAILDVAFGDLDNNDPAMPGGDPGTFMIPEASDDDEAYKRGVEEVRREVIAGNLLQGVLSRRLTIYTHTKALEAYRLLRSNNPSPYLFYLDFGNYQLFGSSPEVHVRIKDGKAMLRPIAGTRRRGRTREEDLSLEAELLADPKERAEHLMLVDLGRNDLGRVCRPGTVRVSDYMVIERYSHVMHIVSQVEGEVDQRKDGLDVLRATFPAGTVSGAPKIRAIEVLSRLEPWQRRFYAGAIGYMEPGGNMDTCIGIRCGLKAGKRLVLQAGAGIVYDSNPERELEETREKMSALLKAVGLDPQQAMRTLDSSEAARLGQGVEDDLSVTVGFSQAPGLAGTFKTAADKKNPGGSSQIQGGIDDLVQGAADLDFDPASIHPPVAAGQPELSGGPTDGLVTEDWGADDGIIPLDWDFDPSEVTGANEIQSEIDSLINTRGSNTDPDVPELEDLELEEK